MQKNIFSLIFLTLITSGNIFCSDVPDKIEINSPEYNFVNVGSRQVMFKTVAGETKTPRIQAFFSSLLHNRHHYFMHGEDIINAAKSEFKSNDIKVICMTEVVEQNYYYCTSTGATLHVVRSSKPSLSNLNT